MADDRAQHLGQLFESERDHLCAVAYRMLGSLTEAEDVVQETWLRLNRSEAGAIENLGGWLTTVVARVCLYESRAPAATRLVCVKRVMFVLLSRHSTGLSQPQRAWILQAATKTM
jgi:DNA-directed RNA polymerase specialized sigma24 family protein